METKVQKWGNSHGVRLPQAILREIGVSPGEVVDLQVAMGKIIIKPSPGRRKKINLEELVKKMPKNYRVEEFDWGRPVGREFW